MSKIKHGKWGTKVYRAWHSMRQRCDNTKNANFKHYGGRGISYDPAWKSFEEFYNDMGDCAKDQELDRVDNSKGYNKNNCRWTSTYINLYNRRRSIKSIYPRGVSKHGKKYRAHITIQYVQYCLGVYSTIEEASNAYSTMALEWFGSALTD